MDARSARREKVWSGRARMVRMDRSAVKDWRPLIFGVGIMRVCELTSLVHNCEIDLRELHRSFGRRPKRVIGGPAELELIREHGKITRDVLAGRNTIGRTAVSTATDEAARDDWLGHVEWSDGARERCEAQARTAIRRKGRMRRRYVQRTLDAASGP